MNWRPPVDESTTEQIDLNDAPAWKVSECDHDFKPDSSDATDYFVAMVCDCGYGYLKRIDPTD
jgi:hypothetical protein